MFRSHGVRRVTCVSFFLGLVFGASVARAEGLTADEVARRAGATSPANDEKRRDIEAAEAQRDKALYDFFPRLAFSGSYYRLSPVNNPALGNIVTAPGAAEGPIGSGTQLVAAPLSIRALENSTNFTAQLTIPISDYVFRLVHAHEGAKAQVRSSEQSLVAQQRKTQYEARAQYYQWVKATLEEAIAQQNLDLSKEHLARVKVLQSADSASEADVARVEATLASSELVLIQQKNVAALERERIEILMHDPHRGAAYEVGEDIRTTPMPLAGIDDLEALVRTAQAKRPEIIAAGAAVVANDRQAAVARAQALPRLDGIGSATAANPNSRFFPQTQDFHTTWQVGVMLTYAPNDTATGLSQAASARAKAEAADARRRQLLDAVRSEVTEAVLSHRNAVAAIETTARRVKAAETSYRARREQFFADKATTVELTEAQTELFRARLDAASAQVSIRVARARIAYAAGSS